MTTSTTRDSNAVSQLSDSTPDGLHTGMHLSPCLMLTATTRLCPGKTTASWTDSRCTSVCPPLEEKLAEGCPSRRRSRQQWGISVGIGSIRLSAAVQQQVGDRPHRAVHRQLALLLLVATQQELLLFRCRRRGRTGTCVLKLLLVMVWWRRCPLLKCWGRRSRCRPSPRRRGQAF